MEPITREEYYLAKIAGTYKSKTPKPVTIEEYYLATMAGDYSGNTPQPVTRLQYYMAKVAGVWGGSIPAPVTRLEYYWAAIASGEGKVFPPVTREEHFLVLVADAYSVVLTVVTGNPALLENSKGNRGLESLTLHGKSTQVSTTGAQLLPFEVGEKREGFEVFKDGIAISGAGMKDIYAVGRKGMTNESSYDDFPLLASGEYYVYIDSASVNLIVVAFRNGTSIILGSSRAGNAAKIKVMDGDKFRIFLRIEEAAFNGKVKAMISKTRPTASNYEPYTGGKPSPSPSYPQEIKSVGQDGEIGVEVLGKNLIPFPYPLLGGAGTQIERKGVKYTVQSDGGIRCVGTPTAIDAIDLTDIRFSEINMNANTPTNGKIVLSGEKLAYDRRNNKLFIYIELDHVGKPINTVVYPQIELGTVATEYEPYKPAQKLIIQTPNGLPGIPVSSGGNYTDEKGNQWVADEIDLARSEKVQRCKRSMLTLRKVGNRYVANGIRGGSTNYPNVICDKFAYNPSANDGSPGIRLSANYDTIVAWCENFEEASSIIEVDVTYVLATPIRTPLPPETIAAYKALKTYSPTTTVINDAGAGMSVGYAKMK